MSQLSNYSVETDQLILLSFEDGRSLRVPISQLPKYLKGRDLQRVRRAINMRRAFFRQNMPPTIIVLIATLVVAALAAAGEHTLAAIFSGASSPGSQLPGAVHMVQSAPATSLVITVQTQPALASPAKKLARKIAAPAASVISAQLPVPTLAPAEIIKSLPAVSVTPSVTPADTLREPLRGVQPSPSPSPTPLAASPSPSPAP
jgi:hypothetical protein